MGAVYKRIVVALDGSSLAESALHQAAELAGAVGAPLHLVRVADATRLHFGVNEAAAAYANLGGDLEREATEASEYLEHLRQRLAVGGQMVTTEVRTGQASGELVATTRSGDLLVMASHGRHGAMRWLLGSVAEDVTRKAKTPVLLVRADPAAGNAASQD